MTILNPYRYATAGNAYDDEVLSDSPLRYWKLDESSGSTASDSSGNGGDGSYINSPTLSVSGPGGEIPDGVSFDGVDQYMEGPVTLGETQAQTWEAWIYNASDITTATSGFRCVGTDVDGDTLQLGASDGSASDEVSVVFQSARVTGWKSFTISAGWHHHVWTYSGTQNGWVYYLDGTTTGTKYAASGGATGQNPTADVTIGSLLFGSGTRVYQDMDASRFAIYDTELSASQVSDHYDAAGV